MGNASQRFHDDSTVWRMFGLFFRPFSHSFFRVSVASFGTPEQISGFYEKVLNLLLCHVSVSLCKRYYIVITVTVLHCLCLICYMHD